MGSSYPTTTPPGRFGRPRRNRNSVETCVGAEVKADVRTTRAHAGGAVFTAYAGGSHSGASGLLSFELPFSSCAKIQ